MAGSSRWSKWQSLILTTQAQDATGPPDLRHSTRLGLALSLTEEFKGLSQRSIDLSGSEPPDEIAERVWAEAARAQAAAEVAYRAGRRLVRTIVPRGGTSHRLKSGKQVASTSSPGGWEGSAAGWRNAWPATTRPGCCSPAAPAAKTIRPNRRSGKRSPLGGHGRLPGR